MVYHCHSINSDESPAHNPAAKSMPKSKKVTNARRNDAKPTRTNPARACKQNHRVAHAIKKHHKQRRREPMHVFVGNLNKTVDEDTIQEYFNHCGKILSVEIRCSGGLAMTTGRPDPAYIREHSVRQYAMVTFVDASAANKALELNGFRLGEGDQSSELVVTRSAADLPEVIEKVQQRLEEYRARNGFADAKRARQSALRALKLQPTILLDVRGDKDPRGKINIFGFSFPMPIF
ncbi:uncharacterized protein EDB91DRAFT_428035 [Suillus paluster]|uniref:uncharacterized protein n=1 Tax=Suillus paluster TaxID=48578 RepID=UPI001B86D00E|nr:uncharacterized protein EDB91DRAFT_428035 [Suillus paluster]KAG1753971.1 hypothetical protein EDB91DRAFT_428035 [Suillus paluster]